MLTTTEAAARIGTTQSNVRVWIRRGRFPNARHIGRDWVIPASDLESFEVMPRGRPPKDKPDEAAKPAKKAPKRAK